MKVDYNHPERTDVGTIKPESLDGFETASEFNSSEVYDETGTQFTDRQSYKTSLDEVTERLGIDTIETSKEFEGSNPVRGFMDRAEQYDHPKESTISDIYDAASRATTAVTSNGYKIGGVKETAKNLGLDIIDENTPYSSVDSRRVSLKDDESSSLTETYNRSSSVWGRVRELLN